MDWPKYEHAVILGPPYTFALSEKGFLLKKSNFNKSCIIYTIWLYKAP